jgi:hypothetical protein
LAAAAGVALVLAGCGGGQREPETPMAAPAPMEPAGAAAPADAAMNPVDALLQLDQAEAELQAALGGAAFAQPPAQPGMVPPATTPARPVAKEAAPGAEAAQASASPCATACRALASMGRATEHLCGLAGESDQRCAGARARVKSATDRVQAQCPGCAP